MSPRTTRDEGQKLPHRVDVVTNDEQPIARRCGTPKSVSMLVLDAGGDQISSLEADFLRKLVEQSLLTEKTASRVARVRLETGDRLCAVILKLGFLTEQALEKTFELHFGLERWYESPETTTLLTDANSSFFRRGEILLLDTEGGEALIACWDALDIVPIRALEFALQRKVRRVIGTRSAILSALNVAYPSMQISPESGEPAVEGCEDEEIDRLKDLASDAPVIRWVQQTIDQAIVGRASDIHLESGEAALKVRFRQDGMLRDIASSPKAEGAAIVSRIKIMAGLNIAETRLPQDGRLRVSIQGKEIDFRVATSPSLHGENVVMRILDRQDVALDFTALGFDAYLADAVRGAISRPHGVVLVTGPTGSGKTTTLYAALKEINTPERKILTVEDPVEYDLQGVTQLPIRPQIGLTFAHALRSFLRQDPDVMMVGEIRDRETAEIAIQAALTGHMLLSTLHTNTAAAAMTRLLDMGIDDFLLTSTLHLVIGQRLVRRLCLCREPFEPTADLRLKAGLDDGRMPWYRAKGCASCQGSGFRGRTAIVEALAMSDRVRAAVLAHEDAHAVERIARGEGMRTMLEHGMVRVRAGETTFEEVLRVTSAA